MGLGEHLRRWAGPEEAERAGEDVPAGEGGPARAQAGMGMAWHQGSQEIGLEEIVKVKSAFST